MESTDGIGIEMNPQLLCERQQMSTVSRTYLFMPSFLYIAVALSACSSEHGANSDAEIADLPSDSGSADAAEVEPRDSSPEAVLCSAPTLACGPTALCVATYFNCGDYLGECRPRPTECEPPLERWRVCECNREHLSLCEVRKSGQGGRPYLCEPRPEGSTECRPDAGIDACSQAGVCVHSVGSANDSGHCLSVADVCSSGSPIRVCAGTFSTPNAEPTSCWNSPCEAWQSGYRGALVVAE